MWSKGLTVRMQRVSVEMPESFRSVVRSEVASSLASLQVTEEGGLGGRLPSNTTGSLEKTVCRPSPEALNRSRSALGLSPPVVVDDGLDADEQAVSKTGFPDDARILEAWCDEHGLRNRSREQVVGSSFARLFDGHPVWKFDNTEALLAVGSVSL